MSKGIYTGVGDIAKASKKFYIGDTDGKARKVKKMYIGDADGKARLCYNRIFTWQKWVSTRTSNVDITYTEGTDTSSTTLDIGISTLRGGTYDSSFGISASASDNYDNSDFRLLIGTSYTFNNKTGIFSLTGTQLYLIGYTIDGTGFGKSNYDIEQNLIGKYVRNSTNECVYKITDHNDTSYLILGERHYVSSQSMRYYYVYNNQGDVTSEDENAYTSASEIPSNYWSSSSNDIRTVYVRK